MERSTLRKTTHDGEGKYGTQQRQNVGKNKEEKKEPEDEIAVGERDEIRKRQNDAVKQNSPRIGNLI